MEYTIYDGNGYYVGAFTSHNGEINPSMIPDGGTVIDGLQDMTTMLVEGEVVPLSGEKLDDYNAELFQILRLDRNKLLAQSDWTQVADAPVNQQAWATYRQALRDLPASTTDPANPIWPSKP